MIHHKSYSHSRLLKFWDVFVFQVRDDYGKLMHLVDGRDAFQSNWLRYVNCARIITEQNIRAVQYDGNIYYMATRQIEIGDELLTFYGEKFAKILGIKPPKKGASKTKGNILVSFLFHFPFQFLFLFPFHCSDVALLSHLQESFGVQ